MGRTADDAQVKTLLSMVVDEAMATKGLVSEDRFAEFVTDVCGT